MNINVTNFFLSSHFSYQGTSLFVFFYLRGDTCAEEGMIWQQQCKEVKGNEKKNDTERKKEEFFTKEFGK